MINIFQPFEITDCHTSSIA